MIGACCEKDSDSCDGAIFLAGVLQCLTGFLIVGWIWSIVWGVEIYQLSKPKVRIVNVDSQTVSMVS